MDRRFFCASIGAAGSIVTLPEAEAFHLRTVLRAVDGERLVLMDGAGTTAEAAVLDGTGKRRHDPIACRILSRETHAPPPLRLTLCVAPPRAKQMSLLVRQATELGVTAIRPFLSERGISRPEADAVDGWLDDAREACKQSGNPWLPAIHPPASFAAVLAAAPAGGYIGAVAAAPVASALPPGDTLALWIGPEGGFTPAELAGAIDRGLVPLHVGPYTLRVETAVVACFASIYQRHAS